MLTIALPRDLRVQGQKLLLSLRTTNLTLITSNKSLYDSTEDSQKLLLSYDTAKKRYNYEKHLYKQIEHNIHNGKHSKLGKYRGIIGGGTVSICILLQKLY